MAQNITPSADRKYEVHISRGASENFLYPPKKIAWTTTSIYVVMIPVSNIK